MAAKAMRSLPDIAELVNRAVGIRPILEENAAEAERLRCLPPANIQALRDTGLCRLMVPKRFGGYETNIRTYMTVMAEPGRGCGSTAWTASLYNICAWLAGLFPDQAQFEIWDSSAESWIPGSLAPRGDARQVDGGWRVTGQWPWASGCLHAQWAACGIHMKDDKGGMANRHRFA